MRIISGTHKGKRFFAPKNLPVRPTTDFAKEGLFNVLTHSIEFTSDKVLDLFCGTGNITYEFTSRGYTNITSADKAFGCVKYVRSVLNKDFAIDNPNVVCSEVIKFLERSPSTFNLVFADPPYDYDQYDKLLELCHARTNKGGLIILEHNKEQDFSTLKTYLMGRKYGNVCFSFFKIAS